MLDAGLHCRIVLSKVLDRKSISLEKNSLGKVKRVPVIPWTPAGNLQELCATFQFFSVCISLSIVIELGDKFVQGEKMSPTIFRYKSYRLYFFSKEEARPHIHVKCPDGEAKFWLEPIVTLANNYGLSLKQLNELQKFIQEKANEIKKAWKSYFKS